MYYLCNYLGFIIFIAKWSSTPKSHGLDVRLCDRLPAIKELPVTISQGLEVAFSHHQMGSIYLRETPSEEVTQTERLPPTQQLLNG